MIAVADPRFLAQVGSPDLIAASAVVSGVSALIGIGVYVWYAFALSKLFPKLEQEAWKGWVPVLNEATILQIGGRPAWNVVFYFLPIVQLYGLYLKVLATHSINKRFGRGAGFTVLAVLLPPVWATLLAWGAPPYPEGDRLASLHGPRRVGTDAARAAGAPSAQGYLAPPIPHGGPVPPAATGSYAPESFAPAAFRPDPPAPGYAPQGFVPQPPAPAGLPPQGAFDPRFSDDPAPDATIPAPYRPAAQPVDPATGLPVETHGQPASPPPAAPLPISQGLIDSVPGAAPHAEAVSPNAEPAQPIGSAQTGASAPPATPAPPFGVAPPAPAFGGAPVPASDAPAPVQPFGAALPVTPGAGQSPPPFPAAPPAPSIPAVQPVAPAHPEASVAQEDPARSAPAQQAPAPPAPAWPDASAPAQAAASAQADHSQLATPVTAQEPVAHTQAPVAADSASPMPPAPQVDPEESWATVASVPVAPAAPPAPTPAPPALGDASAEAPAFGDAPRDDATSELSAPPASAPPAPAPSASAPASAPEVEAPEPFAEPQRLRGSGLGTRADRAASIRPVPVVLPVPETPVPVPAPSAAPVPAADDDDLEATVVVQRSRGPRRVLVLDDGRTFALSATSIVIGRNPEGEPGEQRLAVPDKTRTLSKTHARLVVQGDEWRLTDLHSTNGVVVVADDGAETLLDAGESVTGAGRFVLGEVGMHVAMESDS